MNKTIWAHLAILGANVIYGLNFGIAKSLMPGYIGAQALSVYRVVGATLLFWLLSFVGKYERVERRDLLPLAVAALFGVCINQNLFLKGLSLSSPIDASIIVTSNPVVVLLIASIMLGVPVTFRKITGIAFGILGALFIILKSHSFELRSENTWGNILVFINAVSYSFYLVFIKRLSDRYQPITIVRWLFTISVIPVSLFGWSEMQAINYASYSAQTYWAIGYVIIGATVLTYLLNNYGIKYSSPTVVSTYINAQPIIASLWAVSFGTDSPSVIHFAAASLVVLGVYLVSSPLRTTRKLLRSSLQAVAKKVGRSEY